MQLKEWRKHKKECEKFKVKPRSHVRQLVYFRLIDLYGFDLVLSHQDLIVKILNK